MSNVRFPNNKISTQTISGSNNQAHNLQSQRERLEEIINISQDALRTINAHSNNSTVSSTQLLSATYKTDDLLSHKPQSQIIAGVVADNALEVINLLSNPNGTFDIQINSASDGTNDLQQFTRKRLENIAGIFGVSQEEIDVMSTNSLHNECFKRVLRACESDDWEIINHNRPLISGLKTKRKVGL